MNGEIYRQPTLVARAAVIASGLLIAGCSPDAAPTPAQTTQSTTVESAYQDLAAGPCLVERNAYLDAEACSQAHTKGKIALVYFTGTSRDMAESVANEAEQTLTKVSDSLITVSITPVKASAKAQQTLDASVGDKDCTPLQGEKLAAVAAAETMPEVEAFDLVAAMNTYRECTGRTGATDGARNRYIDVFQSDSTITAKANTLSHETMHGFGEGHMGSELYDTVVHLGNQLTKTGHAKLEDYAQGGAYNGTYQPYLMSKNVMSAAGGSDSDLEPLTPPQKQFLRNEAPTFEPDGGPIKAGESAILWSSDDYFYTKLAQPMTLEGNKESYDNLIVAPWMDKDTIVGAQILVGNRTSNLISLGILNLKTTLPAIKKAGYTITYGEATYTITAQQNQLTVAAQ
jgi:hypothetical protein